METPRPNVVNFFTAHLNNVALFPVWYLVYAFDFWYKAGFHYLIMIYDLMGVGPIARHFFAPFRRDRTWVGYFMGILIRLFWLAASLIILTIMFIAVIFVTAVYYLAPFVLFRWSISWFFAYVAVWLVFYIIYLVRQNHWTKVKAINLLALPELRRRIWRRLELTSEEVDPVLLAGLRDQTKWQSFVDFLRKRDLHEEDYNATRDWVFRKEWRKQAWKFWRDEFFIRRQGVNVGWVAGFLPELKRFSVDLTQEAVTGHLPHVFGRENDLVKILNVLSRPSRNNVLLVGEPGVGKSSIVYSLSWLILGRYADVNIPDITHLVKPIKGRRLIELNTAGFVGGTGGRGDLESRLNEVLHELEEGETILFVNQLENLLQSGMAGYLSPMLATTHFPIIATTTPKVLETSLGQLQEFVSEFEIVRIQPPGLADAVRIMEGVVNELEGKSGVFFTYPAIVAAIELSERYIHNAVLPDKAVKTLIKAAEISGRGEVRVEQVQTALSQMTGVPVGAISTEETEKLLSLDRLLKERIIGQTEAVQNIARAVRRARTGVASNQRPIASLLFLGPTGVGKTLTAKTLAQVYFTPLAQTAVSEVDLNRMIASNFMQFDMSEFSEPGSVVRFLDRITREAKEKPFALLLLDEFEKSEEAIHNLFLQILEEGHLSSTAGDLLDFRNTIVIATSNAIREVKPEERSEEAIRRMLEHSFRPELINRFDGIVVFNSLGANEIVLVVNLELTKLKNRLKQDKEINLTWTEGLVQELSKIGVDPEYGARPLRRIIQDRLEDKLAQKLLRKELQYGDEYQLTVQDLQ